MSVHVIASAPQPANWPSTSATTKSRMFSITDAGERGSMTWRIASSLTSDMIGFASATSAGRMTTLGFGERFFGLSDAVLVMGVGSMRRGGGCSRAKCSASARPARAHGAGPCRR